MITIVLPLFGREELTRRFLDHTPFPVIIADGSPRPQNISHPWVQHYAYHGPDCCPSDYWAKVVLALETVDTPYVMICDNDDFPLGTGLLRCAHFLEHNTDYTCCSGRIQGFWASGRMTPKYARYDTPADYDSSDSNLRVLAGFRNSWSYYAVHRTQDLLETWLTTRSLDLQDFQVHEKFMAMWTLVKGKAKCDPDFTSYLRQYGTGLRYHRLGLGGAQTTVDIHTVLTLMEANGIDVHSLSLLWADWYEEWGSRKRLWPKITTKLYDVHKLAFWRNAWSLVNV